MTNAVVGEVAIVIVNVLFQRVAFPQLVKESMGSLICTLVSPFLKSAGVPKSTGTDITLQTPLLVCAPEDATIPANVLDAAPVEEDWSALAMAGPIVLAQGGWLYCVVLWPVQVSSLTT